MQSKKHTLAEGMAMGYVYGCAVGFPLLVVTSLVWAALGHVQVGLVFAVLGLGATWLTWHLLRTLRSQSWPNGQEETEVEV